MTAPTCLRCGRPTPDGYVCVAETAKAAEQLTALADMVPAARAVAHRLGSTQGHGNGSGKPGSTLPLDLGATARLDAVMNALGGWVRLISEQRGLDYAPRLGGSNS
jgi:hypothetical protein